MSRLRFLAPAVDWRAGKEGTVYGPGHETDYDADDYEFVKSIWLEGKAELLDGLPAELMAPPTEPPPPPPPTTP